MRTLSGHGFFGQPTEQSRAKASIVTEYFDAWSRVMIGNSREIQYCDLFAGRGRYDEGTLSTPLMILEKAIANVELHQTFQAHFNDSNTEFCGQLRQAIGALPRIGLLQHPPTVECREVGVDTYHELAPRPVPTLYFLDPWGYRGLSVSLIGDALSGFGCECILFFNFNQINRFLSADVVGERMRELFGPGRHGAMLTRVSGVSGLDREALVMEEMQAALAEAGASEVTQFRFTNRAGTRPSHYIMHAAKHPKARQIMADIMAKWSSRTDAGVASFEFNPADERQPRLLEDIGPLEALAESLLQQFAGARSVHDVMAQHLPTRPYTRRNYRDALLMLEQRELIDAAPPAHERRPGTMAGSVVITFPHKE